MKRIDTINVIPFIDIMLVLLAIVLTTATFITHGRIQVELPVATEGDPPQHKDTTTITIDRHAQLFYDDTLVTTEQLEGRLDKLRTNAPIILKVDRQVSFGHFIEIIDRLKERKLETFSIVTKPTK